WYNGHPQFTELNPDLSGKTAVVIGAGNVALDVARIMAKTRGEFGGSDIVNHALDTLDASGIERIVFVVRRGPHEIAMTPKELGELGHLEKATPVVETADLPPVEADDALEPGQRKSVTHLRSFADLSDDDRKGKPTRVEFDFFASPQAFLGNGKVEGVEVERTELRDGRAVGTGETYTVPADIVVVCIGYRTSPVEGVPFDDKGGIFLNEEGRISDGLYCVGWARRGPTGTIGTNRPDGFAIIEKVAEDIGEGSGKAGFAGFETLSSERGIDFVEFHHWQEIDKAEVARARNDAPREKFVTMKEMLAATGRS
ncbi:MAG: pyridine nucleotide-disulfide oxidoreductase, partial [Novosphingobium sp.]|nr:pyridine nucleotide-disulfide oxidoreductase [Novosphingobium sp.]